MGWLAWRLNRAARTAPPAYDEEQARTCIVDSYTDHATGNVVYTMDFYHDEPLLSSAVQLLLYKAGRYRAGRSERRHRPLGLNGKLFAAR